MFFMLIFDPSGAAPWPGSWTQGGRLGRRRGRRRGERCSATGKRQGARPRTRGAALLPVSSEAECLVEDLVQAVPARPWPNLADYVGPQCRGMNLSRLWRDGPAHVGDHGEEGVDRIGHVSPRRLRPKVGGGGG